MILVAGATGTLGTRLVKRLRDRGMAVRALTRDPARATLLADLGAEIVRGDLRDATSVQRAAEGATAIVGAAHGFLGKGGSTTTTVDRLGNQHLVDAARDAGADVVLLSVVGASPDSPMDLFRAKYDAEQYLWRSGVRATVVRATAFAETWARILEEPLRASGRPLVFGQGSNPINFVSADTVAALVEHAVIEPQLRAQTLEVGGPENITLTEFASLLAHREGVTTTARHVPRALLRAMAVLLRPIRSPMAEQACAAFVMDTQPMGFDATPLYTRFPDLPVVSVRAILGTGLPPQSLKVCCP